MPEGCFRNRTFRWWPLAGLLFALAAEAGSLGMVSDNSSKRIAVFDTEQDLVTSSLAAAPGRALADCSVTSDERTGYSTSAGNEITVISLSNAAGGDERPRKQVAISNVGIDMALSPDDTFLVLAGGGEIQAPLSVIDTRIQEEVATSGPFADHTSVEFCDDGTLLVTTTFGKYFDAERDNALYDASVDHLGRIGLRGNRLSTGAQPTNSACAPGAYSGVLLDREGGLLSFTLPGLRPASETRLKTGAGHAATFSADGHWLFVRTQTAVEAFQFDPLTGVLSAAWTRSAPRSLAFFGIDQIGLNPEGDKLYVDGDDGMTILDPASGRTAGRLPLGRTTGVCFARARSIPDLERMGQVPAKQGSAGS